MPIPTRKSVSRLKSLSIVATSLKISVVSRSEPSTVILAEPEPDREYTSHFVRASGRPTIAEGSDLRDMHSRS